MEISVGTGSDLSVSTIKSNGNWMILEMSSNKPGGGVCKRIELAGASPITISADSAPTRDHSKIVRMERRDSRPPHHQTAKIARVRTVTIKAVGGSEKPPIKNGIRKQTA